MIQEFDIDLINRKIKEWITGFLFVTATVNSVNAEGCTVTFAGETAATQKRYKRLESANVVQGDRVLMLRMGTTFLIIGKII